MFPSLVSEHMERGTLRDELKRNPDLNVFDMARYLTFTLLKVEGPDIYRYRSMVLQMACRIYMLKTLFTETLSRYVYILYHSCVV